MEVSRRTFLKISGATLVLSTLGINLESIKAYAQPLKIKYAQETTGICPYCAVGCGVIVHSREGKVVNIEGDPDHPINQGALCPKGSSLYQLASNENRVTKVFYRAPYSSKWQTKSWDWALNRIARRIKDTRDAAFEEKNS